MYENKEICSKCGGKCCKRMPGACFPEDFGSPLNEDKLLKAIASGLYAIDWWEGDPRKNVDILDYAYYVRPATKDKVGQRHDPSWGGVCVFFAVWGCALGNNKPLQCKMLEPKEDGNCVLHGRVLKKHAAIAWIPYQHLLER